MFNQSGTGFVPERSVADSMMRPLGASEAIADKELLSLAGFYLPWDDADLNAFDDLLRSYRRLSLADQVVVRGRLLWHILGIEPSSGGADG